MRLQHCRKKLPSAMTDERLLVRSHARRDAILMARAQGLRCSWSSQCAEQHKHMQNSGEKNGSLDLHTVSASNACTNARARSLDKYILERI
jgi:hypothetical protein